MLNLFSAFEPQTFLSLPLNWITIICILLYLPQKYWTTSSSYITLTKVYITIITIEISTILPKHTPLGFILIPLSLFLYIFLSNIRSLFPYIFTNAGHLSFRLSLALPLWLGYMAYRWVLSNTHRTAHLVPLGTPNLLIPLIVLIELISSLIRPITLSVRLTANLIAGHLLLTLLRNQIYYATPSIFILILVILLCLTLLEVFVSFIQSYVFCVLSTLYANEANTFSII